LKLNAIVSELVKAGKLSEKPLKVKINSVVNRLKDITGEKEKKE
jgi:polyhydroxyalkanoate synthesis regulator phasin